jgi:hypothetical protein
LHARRGKSYICQREEYQPGSINANQGWDLHPHTNIIYPNSFLTGRLEFCDILNNTQSGNLVKWVVVDELRLHLVSVWGQFSITMVVFKSDIVYGRTTSDIV